MALSNLSPVFFSSVSFVTATAQVDLGTERTEAGTKYLYVYNCGISTAGTGTGMSRPVSAAAGLYSGSVSAVSGDMPLGFVKHTAIPAGEYGWVVTRGLVTVSVISSVSTQDVGPKALGPLGVIATIGAGYYPIGELTTAIVSGNVGALYVNLR